MTYTVTVKVLMRNPYSVKWQNFVTVVFRHKNFHVSKSSFRSKLILNCFQSRNPILLAKAFCTFVRPTLEYCSVVWSPALKEDIYRLEAVQRRFTKRLTVLRNIPYCDRLAYLNFWTVYLIDV